MKNKIFFLLTLALVFKLRAQTTTIVPNAQDSRVITTGVPFLLIAPDARAAALGDMGVATGVDAFSQQWNSSKYVFSDSFASHISNHFNIYIYTYISTFLLLILNQGSHFVIHIEFFWFLFEPQKKRIDMLRRSVQFSAGELPSETISQIIG